MTTQTERITLSLCDKHQIGEPYVFETLDTELELTLGDWLAVGAVMCGADGDSDSDYHRTLYRGEVDFMIEGIGDVIGMAISRRSKVCK